MTRPTPADPAIFCSAPDVRAFQPLGSIEACREQLEFTLRSDAGLGVVIGPAGTGKSLLCQVLADALRDPFDVVVLAETAPRDQISLLQNILFHLNMPYKNLTEGELRLSLIDRVRQGAQSREKALVLIVDEAQGLPDAILEEIRMISNIARDGRSCVRTLLAGNHELEERLALTNMESLAQRVAVRCYLHPFTNTETAAFVRTALASQSEPQTIDDEAAAALHFATGGVPRVIQQLMRQVLNHTKDGCIGADQINQAWSQSRQLASPVMDLERPIKAGDTEAQELAEEQTAVEQCESSFIEFGELSVAPATVPETGAEQESIVFEEENSSADEELASHPEPSEPDELAESMPEVAAEIDRVTDSLLRIAHEDYDESSVLPEESDAEATEQYSEAFQCDGRPRCEEGTCQSPQECQRNASEVSDTDASHASDISVIDASIEWSVEEPAEHDDIAISAKVVHPEELFGNDFEDEETIAVQDDCQPERALHREVASISAAAAEIQLHGNDITFPSFPVPAIGSDGVGSGYQAAADDGLADEGPTDDIYLSDDSDLLIVEEIVDIEPVPIGTNAFDDDPTDTIDYQKLLNRMRQV